LFDVLGNVWEWCADLWHDNYHGAPDDGSKWTMGGDPGRCVVRGGSWDGDPRDVRASVRNVNGRGTRDDSVGFRLSRTLSAPTS
jgi:formylglycine-generating enzyme required for sulfatase activity